VIEQKIDKLSEAVQKLVLIDERQITQGTRMGKLEEQMGSFQSELNTLRSNHHLQIIQLERKVDKWINLFWGGWAVFSFGLMVWQKFF